MFTWAARVASLGRRWLNPARIEDELDSEVRAYFEIRVERFVSRGMPLDEARRAARLEFEGLEQIKQTVRESRMGANLDTIIRDTIYAFRILRKSPGFAMVAVLTLALGIGANTAIFSLINTVMLRSLPVDHPEQLVLLTDPSEGGISVDTSQGGVRTLLAYPEFEQLRMNNTVFSGLFAAQSATVDLDVFPESDSSAQPVRAHTQLVSGEFFQVLGVQPVRGRAFTPAEDKTPGANPVAVVSYDFWQRALGGRPSVIGIKVRIGSGVFQVLGVAPPDFHGILVGSDTDFWLPITMQQQVYPNRNYLTPRDTLWLQVMGRLMPGVSMQTAQAGINVTFQNSLLAWSAELPTEKQRKKVLDQKIALRPGARGASELRGQFSDPLILVMCMVGVVLLIACANIANLMLARANGRRREIGVRLALGAARWRLIRQLLTESLVVAAGGGILGILAGAAGTRLLLTLVVPGSTAPGWMVPQDLRVLGFTAVISLATGVLFGLAPALRSTRVDVHRTLAANSRGSIGGKGRAQSGRILAVAQVALSLVLLMGAALFVRSLHNLTSQNLGFDQDHLLSVRVDPVAAGYQGARQAALYSAVREKILTIPGVRGVTVSNSGLFGGDSADHLLIEASPVKDPEQLFARWTEVGPDYFKTLGIPLLQGREIALDDVVRGAQVCVINQSFARHFFPEGGALGKHITDQYPTTRETFEIVGIVADALEHQPNERKWPRFYSNLTHPIGAVLAVTFLIRSTGDPASLGTSVRQAIRQLDPNLPVVTLHTVNALIDRRLATQRLVAQLAAFFGGVALFMAAIGLYGVMSYSISGRASEIGIRMALGASAASVIRMVLRETLGMVLVGVALGSGCALALGRAIASRLYGLSAADPVAISVATLTILITAVLAGYLPARRASKIDPMVSLRVD